MKKLILAVLALSLLLCGCGVNKDIRKLECNIELRDEYLNSRTVTLRGSEAAELFDYMQQYNSYIDSNNSVSPMGCETVGACIYIDFFPESPDSVYQGCYAVYRSDCVGYSPAVSVSARWYSQLPDGSYENIYNYIMSTVDKNAFEYIPADADGFTCKVTSGGAEKLLTDEAAMELYRLVMAYSDSFKTMERCEVCYNELPPDGIRLVFSDEHTAYGAFMISASELYFSYGGDYYCEKLYLPDGMYDEISQHIM